VVERSVDPAGPWTVLADDVSDAEQPYEALFSDASAVVGERYHYRVRARNTAGLSPPSNVVGPISVSCATLIDTMRSWAIPYGARGDVAMASTEDRRFRERLYRRRAERGNEILYALPAAISRFRVQAFAQETRDPLVILGSADGRIFRPLPVRHASVSLEDEDYGYWRPILYAGEGDGSQRYLKIVFRAAAELSRVEIDHAPGNRGAGGR
jgi:hypothetical protein